MTTQISTTNIQPAALAFIQGPVVSSIQITNSSYTVLDDTAVDTAGGYIKINGVNFVAGMNVVIGSVTATSVSVVSSTVLNVQVPAQSAGTYIVYVIAPDGGVSIVINGLTYSGTPTWVTGSTLTSGTVDTAISIQLDATGANSYALAAGSSLPAGLSLTSGGLLSGTVTGITVETLYNFTINAIDTELQDSPRAFTITIAASDQYFEYVTSLLSASTPTSTFVADASTNSFAVTVNGDTRPSNFGPYTPGYYSNYFDGNGDSISLAGNAAFTMPGDFTAEAWVFMTAYTGSDYSAIFGFSKDDENTGWNILVTSNGTPHINVAMTYTNCTGTIPLNKWTHVALVRSGSASGNVKLYINGVADATTLTVTATATSPSTVMLGGYPGIAARAFSGYISNARVVKGTAVYTSNFAPGTVPLTAIANTSLLTCQSNRFIDNSTNNFTVTRNGDTAISGFDPFVPDSSYTGYGSGYFDGTGDYVLTQSTTAMNLGANPFCLEMWVYLNATGSTYYGICGSQTDYKGPSICRYNSNLMYGLSSNGSSWNVLSAEGSVGSITINPYTWYHVVLCRTGNTISAYVNGARDLTITSSATLVSRTEGFCIGNWFAGLYPWNGYISNARFVVGSNPYDATQTTITVPTTPLTAIANTQLLTLQNNQPNNNSMFLDSSTNNFNITRNGNTTQGTFSPYGGGWSAYFGSGNYLSAASNAAFGFGTGDFTVEAWVFPNAAYTTYNYIWASGETNGFVLYVLGGVLYVRTFNGSDLLASSTAPALNTWTHVAATRSGTTLRIFVNGVQTASATNSTNFATGSALIGNDGTNVAPWLGYISNLRVVKGTALYTSNFTPSTTPLTPVAGTSLLACADNRFIDDSANGFAITVTGTPTIQRFNPFNPVTTIPTSYSGFFDGNGDYLTTPSNAALAFGSTDFCLEFWIYTTAFGSTDSRPLGNNNSWAANAWSLHSDHSSANEKYTFWVHNYNSSSPMFTSTSSAALNTWTHVAITRSGNSWRMFINGTQEGSTVTSSAALDGGSSDDMYIGGSGAANEYVTGYMSNVRAVKGSAVYTSNFTPSTTPLTAIANTSLLTLQSATFIDNSTNNFTITANGNTAPRQFNPFGWTSTTGSNAAYTTALYGGSGYFDGTGDFLTIPSNNAFVFGTGDFTLESWTYLTSAPASPLGSIVANGGNSNVTSNVSFNLYITSALVPSLYIGTSTTGSITLTSSTAITIGAWNHIAATRSGNTFTLWLNGVSVATGTSSVNISALLDVFVSKAYSDLDNRYITGYISDLRLTKGQARYTSNFAPPVAPLTALQNTVLLNNMTGAGIYDSSMMTNYETVGNASINTALKKYGNTSMYFDGTGDALVSPANINLAVGSGDFTIEMWVNGANNGSAVGGSFPRLFTLGTAQGSGCIESYNSSGTMYVDISGAGGPISFTASTLLNSTWNHYAITRSGTSLKAFVNGTQVGTTATNSTNLNLAATTQSWIGAISASAGNFNGYLDDFRITKGVARYTTTFTPPASPFIRF